MTKKGALLSEHMLSKISTVVANFTYGNSGSSDEVQSAQLHQIDQDCNTAQDYPYAASPKKRSYFRVW